MAKRTWTYEELTEIAEQSICLSMKLMKDRQLQENYDSARRLSNCAWGKFCMWDAITKDCQEPGDADRLEALVKVHRG